MGSERMFAVLEDTLEKEGVAQRLVVVADQPTGHCLGLVQGDQRTLVANLGAAAHFQLDDLWAEDNRSSLGQSTIIYVEGFFLSHSPDVVLDLAKFSQSQAGEQEQNH